jgi:hypothetical protein
MKLIREFTLEGIKHFEIEVNGSRRLLTAKQYYKLYK